MKKLITLFAFLAFFSLIFIGCQSTDNITSPVDDLAKPTPPPPFVWGELTAITSPVDLIAGQHTKVGIVEITSDGTNLMFKYNVNEGCTVTEMHVDLAYLPRAFTVNNNFSPTFGNFDSKNWATFDYDNYTVTFDAAGLVGALGYAPTAGQSKIYMAIHGVVCCGGEEVVTEGICPDLTGAQGAMLLQGVGNFWTVDNPTHYMNNLRFTKTVVPGVEVFKGWCLDPIRGFDFNPPYYERPLTFVCSTDGIQGNCIIYYPENLKKANWIINNRGNYSIEAVQYALWVLLSEDADKGSLDAFKDEAEQLLATIPDLSNWTPGCGDKVLVIVYETATTDPCNVLLQPIGIEVEVECESTGGECETAMAFPEGDIGKANGTTNTSWLFNHQWFRYIAFNF